MSNNDNNQLDPSRRSALAGGAFAAAAAVASALPLAAVSTDSQAATTGKLQKTASTITTRDGVEIYYKDWGPRNGQPVILSHGSVSYTHLTLPTKRIV